MSLIPRTYAKYLSNPLFFVLFVPIPDGTLRERGSLFRDLCVSPNTFGDGFFKGFDLLLLARLDRRIAQCLDGLVDIAIKVTFGRDNLSKNMDILILRQSVWFFGVICSITFLDVFEPDTIYQTPPLPEFKPENT
ncbi:hypothetical protein H6G25_14240 [Dolichospermum sp. FACHB-1091]|uniref:hypothetical protein n=1 Tax=Dolichospermum sp. FACHB-1091 TaxID=2692798 RepID=UPI0016814D9C|nr:hypothetical protein [Dolichospermum sp. FACHB-1091]MBD2444326.1 hypothetical protein [Dolichospermum sp. FACHB-1091]